MGHRYIEERYQLSTRYSPYRAHMRLNESDWEPHKLRAYGMGTGKFWYRGLFDRKQRDQALARTPKKAERQRAKRELALFQQEGDS